MTALSHRLAKHPMPRWGAVLVVLLCASFTTACAKQSDHSGKAAQPSHKQAKRHVQKPKINAPVRASLMKTLHQVSMDGLDNAVVPTRSFLRRIPETDASAGKNPLILYMGADYCPYCASLRWPLVMALSRFGDFSSLKYMRSSGTDVHPNTITFSFQGSHYTSDYIRFQSVELADRDGNKLETPTPRQKALFRQYDTKPYTPSPGGIPFLYVAGRYMQSGAPFSPNALKGLTWSQAANKLGTKSPLTRKAMGAANLYTAAICQATGDIPAGVCATEAVSAAARKLPGSH